MSSKFVNDLSPKKALIFGAIAGLLVILVVGAVIWAVAHFSQEEVRSAENGAKQEVAKNLQEDVLTQISPSDKPAVELFVMSYCPYGTQMQKAFLPVMKLLGGKADIKIKFVSYTMHGDKEARENNREYCIQKNSPDKFVDYLTCFLDKGGQTDDKDDIAVAESCMAAFKINKTAVEKCMAETTAEFKISGTSYPVYAAENTKYGVEGSPTLVVNGARVSPSTRSPEAVKDLICSAFTNKPAECDQTLSETPAAAGFGLSAAGSNSSASCN